MGTGRGERQTFAPSVFVFVFFFLKKANRRKGGNTVYQILMIKIGISLNVLFLYHEYFRIISNNSLKNIKVQL